MNRIQRIATSGIASLLLSSAALAHEPEFVLEADGWVGSVGAGLVITDGNTETESGNALIDISRIIGDWTHSAAASALWTSDSEGTTAEKYFLSLQTDRALSERSYVFGYASYDDDRFSGFDYQATAAVGYGYRVIMSDKMNLRLEAGPGYRISRPFTLVTVGNDTLKFTRKENEVIGRFAEIFDWQFSDNAKLLQELNIEAGSDNTVTRFLVALETNVIGAVAFRVSYGLKHNSDVSPGTDKRDTETAFTLAYSF